MLSAIKSGVWLLLINFLGAIISSPSYGKENSQKSKPIEIFVAGKAYSSFNDYQKDKLSRILKEALPVAPQKEFEDLLKTLEERVGTDNVDMNQANIRHVVQEILDEKLQRQASVSSPSEIKETPQSEIEKLNKTYPDMKTIVISPE